MKTSIILIEDDADGTTVILRAPNQELLRQDAGALWEDFSQYRNPGFSDPNPPGLAEFSEDGGLACSFDVSYPIKVAAEVVEDWLKENSTVQEKDETDYVFHYW